MEGQEHPAPGFNQCNVHERAQRCGGMISPEEEEVPSGAKEPQHLRLPPCHHLGTTLLLLGWRRHETV